MGGGVYWTIELTKQAITEMPKIEQPLLSERKVVTV